MTRLLALTLLIGFFAFLPSASADGDNGLHIIPADVHQSASSGTAMLTLNASNIQVRAKWRLDGDSPFAITDNGELRLTAELSDPSIIVATVIVEDMFSELNSGYQNLAATALITVEFISGTLRIVNPPARLLAAFGMGGTMAFHTSGGMGERVFRLYSASDYFTLGETSGILSVAASVAVGQYEITVEVRDETATLFITVIAEVEAADNLILVDAPPLTATAIAGIALSLHTFTASGGLGILTYALIGNHAGHFSIDERDGVLRTHGDAKVGIYMLSVEVSDGVIIPQRATAMATVAVVEVLILKAKVSDRARDLHDFSTPYASAYSIVAGNDDGYLTMGKTSGVLRMKALTPAGNYPLDIGIIYTFSLGIPPKVVVSAAVVEITDYPTPTQRKIYVLGGEYENDVWSSVNGINWSLETNSAAWSWRSSHQALSHNGRLYILGGSGFASHRLNDVWSSVNGINWSLETSSTAWRWTGRYSHQALSHNGRIYVLGGSISSYSRRNDGVRNDVWSSADGKNNWVLETNYAGAGWTRRSSHQALSHNGRIYVLGGAGYYYSTYNDVWSSTDGKNWGMETANAGWRGRSSHQALSHNGRIYVLGGRYGSSYSNSNRLNDVWSSVNGINWSLETSSAAWTGRSSHQALSYNGRIYVLGGYDGNNHLNDVWSSVNGINWSLEASSAAWTGRSSHQAVIFPPFPPSLAWLALPDTDEFTFPFGESVIIHTFEAQHGDGNYIYNLLSDISGFSLSTNGELSTDGTATTGEHTITVQVADGDGQAITWTGKVIIICPGCKKQ